MSSTDCVPLGEMRHIWPWLWLLEMERAEDLGLESCTWRGRIFQFARWCYDICNLEGEHQIPAYRTCQNFSKQNILPVITPFFVLHTWFTAWKGLRIIGREWYDLCTCVKCNFSIFQLNTIIKALPTPDKYIDHFQQALRLAHNSSVTLKI